MALSWWTPFSMDLARNGFTNGPQRVLARVILIRVCTHVGSFENLSTSAAQLE